MLVQEFLEKTADRTPGKTALICDGQRLTYADVEMQANRVATALRGRGLRRGERVGIYLPNSVELVVGIFAVLKAGGVFVVVNATAKADKLASILKNCTASALLTSAQQMDPAHSLQSAVPSLRTIVLTGDVPPSARLPTVLTYADIQAQVPPDRPPCVNIDLDLACLIYTSGTTGEPKGVMSDHSNVDFASTSITTYLENTPDDIVIDVLPLSFDYGLYQLLMTFKVGGTLVLERGFAYPAAVLKQIETERVTGLPGVPTLFSLLLQMDLGAFDLSSLRYITNTAAALPASHILRLRERLPWATLYSMYGLTETKRTLYLPPDQLDQRPGSVGIAIPGTEVWLQDEHGQRLGPGLTGELIVRGRHVMRGYWGDAALTAARFRPGLLPGERVCYSGDLFRMDEAGYFYFIARKDDMLKSRGEKVAPVEVERVLYELEGVVEAAVVGVPDPVLGQAIKAFVVAQGRTLTERDVLAHCRSRLEDFMVPQQVEFREALPKTPSGKIRKADLQ